jgi:hypothetical protein
VVPPHQLGRVVLPVACTIWCMRGRGRSPRGLVQRRQPGRLALPATCATWCSDTSDGRDVLRLAD